VAGYVFLQTTTLQLQDKKGINAFWKHCGIMFTTEQSTESLRYGGFTFVQGAWHSKI